MSTLRIASAVLFLAACGDDDVPSLECSGDSYGYVIFSRDGERESTGCIEGSVYTSSSEGVPRVQFTALQPVADGGPSVRLAEMLCSVALTFIDVPVTEGESGNVEPRSAADPNVEFFATYAEDNDCVSGVIFSPTTGRYRVLEGESWNSVVEVEVTDVALDPAGDETIRIERMVVRGMLGPDPTLDEPPDGD